MLEKGQDVPELEKHNTGEHPIFGFQIDGVNSRHEQMTIKEKSDFYWSKFMSTICSQKKDEQE